MTLHYTRIQDFVAEKIQDRLQTRFAMHDPHLDPLKPTPFIALFHLPIRQALGPAQERTTGPTGAAGVGDQIATSKGFEDGRLIAFIGIGEDRR